MPAVDLTARLARDSRRAEKDTILFDKALPGFGLRIHPSGRKVWIVQTRIDGRSRRIVIARHGEMELAEARRRARDMLACIRAGENPADEIRREKQTPTLREFADEYLRRCEPHWKPSGRSTMRIYLKARVLPAFGRMPLDRIGPEDVAAWFDAASRDRPGAANPALEILRAMMFRAEEWGLRERGSNPCLGIAKKPRNRIARFLDADELARLGRALDAREPQWSEAVAAIRLMALTGCRRSEVPICAGATSERTPSTLPIRRPARARCRSARPRRRTSRRFPVRTTPPRTCFRDTPRVGARIASQRVGGRYATTRNSAACASMTFVIPQPVGPSCPARICPWAASCSVIDGTEPRRATHILPTGILSRRRSRWEALSPQPWEAASMLRRRVPASVHALSNQPMTVFTTGRHAGLLPGNGLKRE